MKSVLRSIIRYTNLDGELDDFNVIYEKIQKDIIFKGTNLWILIFAIIVASVGLNMNSTAVIIGAMLISPLMGPINGIGYAVATYDLPLFQKAVKNYSFAVFASLIASTAYFAMSPVSTAHSELLARTSPTIYDVLIALFGGFAGIVAISSKQKGNVIPGVAIATALMPPLCTAGYGLATGQFYYFFGAFYLFTINTVFIAIASMIVSQVLKFPIRTIVDRTQRKKVNQLISIVIVITLLPSVYFGYLLVQKEQFKENANSYVKNIGLFENNFLLKHDINPDKREIELIYGGSTLTDVQKSSILEKASNFNLSEARISIKQGISISNAADSKFNSADLNNEIQHLKAQLELQSDQEKVRIAKYELGQQLLKEMRVLFPNVQGCTMAESYWYEKDKKDKEIIAVVGISTTIGISNSEKTKISKWLTTRTGYDYLKIFWEVKS